MTTARFAIAALLALILVPQTRADALDDYARDRMKQLGFPGLAVAVVRNGEVARMRTWGLADVAKKTPVTRDTVFELGSLSKQFTAVAVMMLAEEGKLRIDESIARYLPEVPGAWAKITIRNLLTHSAGVKEYLADAELAGRVHAAANHDEVGRLLLEGLPLEFAPADTWSYSNSGYLLLGRIVERTSGMTYGGFLEQRIFAPLGMSASGISDGSKRKNAARGYGLDDGKFVPRDPVPPNAFAAGGVVSTIADMARWDAALRAGKLLTKESWEEIWTPLALSRGGTPPFSYGFGWVIDRHHGETVVLHSGGTPGFSSAIRRHLGTGTSVVVLANRGDRIVDHLAMELGALLVPELARTTMDDPDRVRSVYLHRALKNLIRGRPEPELLTPEMQLFLATASGRGLFAWIASHGNLTSFAFAEGERDGESRILRYRVRLDETPYWFTITLTKTGKIAQIYWW